MFNIIDEFIKILIQTTIWWQQDIKLLFHFIQLVNLFIKISF